MECGQNYHVFTFPTSACLCKHGETCQVTAIGSSQEADLLSPSGHGDEASRADSLRNSNEDFLGKISTISGTLTLMFQNYNKHANIIAAASFMTFLCRGYIESEKRHYKYTNK